MRVPLLRAIELDVGESQEVVLCDGAKATVKLLDLKETRDELRGAVRHAEVTVEVNGERVTLTSAMYRLPQTVAGVRIDCPVTKGYQGNAHKEGIWGLAKDARLRLWPAGSPLVDPATFVYPVKQRWFASGTQMANEPVFVDGGEVPANKSIYYHYGLDIGGAEGMVDVVAATDGLVVSVGEAVLDGYKDTPVAPRYDVVYLLDDRGWFYRYSHLHTIAEAIKPGRMVKIGQPIGVLGKEGGSGGWSHLHFDIFSRQPSGEWGVQEGYGFLWEAYLREYKPEIIAVARPHHFATTGERVTLDATRSWSRTGKIATFGWTFSDGSISENPLLKRKYESPGTYSEILKVTDDAGNTAYDFAVVQVIDSSKPAELPPSIQATYSPTLGIKPGDEVSFQVRSFRTTHGGETWHFGDGSEPVSVKSDGNAKQLAKDGFAMTKHRFEKPGQHIVRVEHTAENGHTATAHLVVVVEE
jgi:murein DD-endopeptidase MepM/ murein hydrolase activator NlpD